MRVIQNEIRDKWNFNVENAFFFFAHTDDISYWFLEISKKLIYYI